MKADSMHENELWQVYSDNGNPVKNDGRGRSDFKSMIKDPEAHPLITQGRLYFDSLVNSIEYVAFGKNTLI